MATKQSSPERGGEGVALGFSGGHGPPCYGPVQRVDAHQHAKYRQYLSIGCKDIKSFQFFNMAAIGRSVAEILRFFEILTWPPPPHGFLKSRNFIDYWCGEGRESRRISMLNFVKIGQSVAKILRLLLHVCAWCALPVPPLWPPCPPLTKSGWARAHPCPMVSAPMVEVVQK